MKVNEKTDLRSPLNRAKGFGSGKTGVGHWWYQRVTAVALIPLSWWFIRALMGNLSSPNVTVAAEWFASPVNALLVSVMLIALFYHAKLGLQVVIEDYIKCPCTKYSLLLANVFFCFAGAAFSLIAVLKLHFLDIAANSL